MSKSTEDLIRELESGGVLGEARGRTSPAHRTAGAVKAGPEGPGSSGVIYVLIAAVLIALVGSIPLGDYALYPLGLFVTLVHETSHAIAATATGGTVFSLRISPDQSGVTRVLGGWSALVASAGYLGATIAGAALLLTPLRYARWAVGALAVFPLLALIFFHPASLFTGIWAAAFLVALGAAAWRLKGRALGFLQIFLGVACGLNAFRDLMTLLFISGTDSHIHTDAATMSGLVPLPATVWAVLWTVLSVVILLGSLAVMARRDRRVGALLGRGRA
jgi:Peptidase M50B-like